MRFFVPGAAEITVAPGPLFLTGGNVMICHMEKAGLSVLVVVSDEIVVGMSSHVGGGNLHIFITGNVHAGRIVVFIVFPGGDGKVETARFPWSMTALTSGGKTE